MEQNVSRSRQNETHLSLQREKTNKQRVTIGNYSRVLCHWARSSTPAPRNEAEECRPYPSKQNTEMEGKPLKALHTLNASEGEHSAYRNFLFP